MQVAKLQRGLTRVRMQRKHYDEHSGFYRDVSEGNTSKDGEGLEVPLHNPNAIGGGPAKVSCLVSGQPRDEELQLLSQVWPFALGPSTANTTSRIWDSSPSRSVSPHDGNSGLRWA